MRRSGVEAFAGLYSPASSRQPSAGNTPPTLTYGPGVRNLDLAIQKDFPIGKSDSPRVLSFKAEAYNFFNHFNPGNPNTSLAINCNAVNGQCTAPTGLRDYTSTTFGTITTAQVQARHVALTLRLRF